MWLSYYLGYVVKRLLRVVYGEEKPTDRDSYLFKRLEIPGTLVYDLFREFCLLNVLVPVFALQNRAGEPANDVTAYAAHAVSALAEASPLLHAVHAAE